MYYKSPDNKVHFIDDVKFTYLLPSGSFSITESEALSLCSPATNQNAVRDSLLSELRKVREQILNRLSGIALAAQISGSQSTADAYVVARQSLLDITSNLPSDPTQLQATVVSRYQMIVGTLLNNAPELVTAFAGVDL